mmetsp:Transcript_101524/g.295880  ORF Transcript_101524/g.295880 Transcript_101524/m.295880 type:complete len:383 (-) Transcript_101524:125-1273(-)
MCPVASTTSFMYCLLMRGSAAARGREGERSRRQMLSLPVASTCSVAFRALVGEPLGQLSTGPNIATLSGRAPAGAPSQEAPRWPGASRRAGLSERLLPHETEREGRSLGTWKSAPRPGPRSSHSETRQSSSTWWEGLRLCASFSGERHLGAGGERVLKCWPRASASRFSSQITPSKHVATSRSSFAPPAERSALAPAQTTSAPSAAFASSCAAFAASWRCRRSSSRRCRRSSLADCESLRLRAALSGRPAGAATAVGARPRRLLLLCLSRTFSRPSALSSAMRGWIVSCEMLSKPTRDPSRVIALDSGRSLASPCLRVCASDSVETTSSTTAPSVPPEVSVAVDTRRETAATDAEAPPSEPSVLARPPRLAAVERSLAARAS